MEVLQDEKATEGECVLKGLARVAHGILEESPTSVVETPAVPEQGEG